VSSSVNGLVDQGRSTLRMLRKNPQCDKRKKNPQMPVQQIINSLQEAGVSFSATTIRRTKEAFQMTSEVKRLQDPKRRPGAFSQSLRITIT